MRNGSGPGPAQGQEEPWMVDRGQWRGSDHFLPLPHPGLPAAGSAYTILRGMEAGGAIHLRRKRLGTLGFLATLKIISKIL